jgi:predicted RNA-binding protein with PUA-like domain
MGLLPHVERHWLVKTEPESFSIQDLAETPRQTTCWDGVRNFQARNFLQEMRIGDLVLFYHSSAEPAAVVGVCRVVREAYPDDSAWNRKSDHYDAKASPENPIWQMVDIKLKDVFRTPVSIDELRKVRTLAKLELLRRGSRLSVHPVTPEQFATVLQIAIAKAPPRRRGRGAAIASSNLAIRLPAIRPKPGRGRTAAAK